MRFQAVRCVSTLYVNLRSLRGTWRSLKSRVCHRKVPWEFLGESTQVYLSILRDDQEPSVKTIAMISGKLFNKCWYVLVCAEMC
jgi:hypothetical protein